VQGKELWGGYGLKALGYGKKKEPDIAILAMAFGFGTKEYDRTFNRTRWVQQRKLYLWPPAV